MDPTTTCCPNWDCPARGQSSQGNIGIHSRKDRRFICMQCRKAFSATKGTVFYRLRTSAETVVLVGFCRKVQFLYIPPDCVVRESPAHRKPPDVRRCRVRPPSRVGTVPPATA